MNKLYYYINQASTKIVIKLSGNFVISFFVNFYIISPLYNMYRCLFVIKYNPDFLFFLYINLLFLWMILKLYPSISNKILKGIFSEFLVDYRHIVCLGSVLLKNFPYFYIFYFFLSVNSYYLVRNYPDIFWIYLFYCICVLFRNIFIIPGVGFAFIININKKQCEHKNRDEMDILLFKNTILVSDFNYTEIFYNWVEWFKVVKPCQKIVKTMSSISLSISSFWFFLVFYQYFILSEILLGDQLVYSNKDFYKKNENIRNMNTNNPLLLICKEIATNMNKQIQLNNLEHSKFLEKEHVWYSFNLFENNKLQKNTIEINDDCIFFHMYLNFYQKNTKSEKYQDFIIYLTRKYAPERKCLLEKILEKNV
jgi:hypothetical protein